MHILVLMDEDLMYSIRDGIRLENKKIQMSFGCPHAQDPGQSGLRL